MGDFCGGWDRFSGGVEPIYEQYLFSHGTVGAAILGEGDEESKSNGLAAQCVVPPFMSIPIARVS